MEKKKKAKTLLLKKHLRSSIRTIHGNVYWEEAHVAAKEAYDFCVAKGIALTPNYSDIWIQEQGPEVVFPVVNSN